jgi:hypothetical protein
MPDLTFARAAARLALTLAAAALAPLSPAFAGADCPRVDGAGGTPNRTAYGLTTDHALVRFKTCAPQQQLHIGVVSGLIGADTRILGLDFRVQDGLLYGLADGGGIYTIDRETAVATPATQLTLALEGSRFAIDFNPAANALRIVSDSGQNLRHPFATGITAADTPLNYTAGVTATGIVGVGYTNNDLDANTGTALFDIDATLNQVALQAPANNGSLTLAGKLGVDPDTLVGFDVHSRLMAGATSANVGFASMRVAGDWGFYRIDLLTGRATPLGRLTLPLADIAVALD